MPDHKKNLNYGAPSAGFAKAKQLRKKMTLAEQILWKQLRNSLSGYKFRRQHPLGIYIADFYSHELKLVIELDGSHHLLQDEKKYDKSRTFTLNLDGIKVLRFRNQEVIRNVKRVIERINGEINFLTSQTSSP
jgi:very-short-patch-repair endonuclease